MKKTIIIILFLLFALFSSAQYPIQTIFKGDSVVILSLEQSESINNYLEKSEENLSKKNGELTILKFKIDSLENVITKKNRIISEFESKSETYKNENESLFDSLWAWSLGPSLIFSQYDSDSTIYVYDLSNFWLGFYHRNITLNQMTEWDQKKYFNQTTRFDINNRKVSNLKINLVNSKYFFDSKNIRRKKLWRYKSFGTF